MDDDWGYPFFFWKPSDTVRGWNRIDLAVFNELVGVEFPRSHQWLKAFIVLYLGAQSIWTQQISKQFLREATADVDFCRDTDGETRGVFPTFEYDHELKFETAQHIRLHGLKLRNPVWGQLLPLWISLLWWIWSGYLYRFSAGRFSCHFPYCPMPT